MFRKFIVKLFLLLGYSLPVIPISAETLEELEATKNNYMSRGENLIGMKLKNLHQYFQYSEDEIIH